MPLGEVIPNPDREGRFLYVCSVCQVQHITQGRADRCCTYQCGGCGQRYLNQGEAQNCCPRFACGGCGRMYYFEDERDECYRSHQYEEGEVDPDHDYYEEQIEEVSYHHGYGSPGGLYPEEALATDPEHILYIEGLPNRPARLCSIEQEITAGGRAVAKMLYDLGFSESYDIMNYSRDAGPHAMVVKEDGSLPHGGGEVVYSQYALSRSEHARDVSKALACVEALQRDGHVQVGTQAGTHVHVSALDVELDHLLGPPQMAALYEIFSFAEDVIFRLAAAGWPEHRGHGHTQPLIKMERPTPGRIAQEATGSRYFSLSFTRLLNAARQCSCGACWAGGWHDCTCEALRRGTVEWRIFNSTTDPRLIHAWTLIAQGLTAASFDYELGSLEPNEINWSTPPRERHAWILGWILQNCPFTDPERQIIIECARQAPHLTIDWGEFDRVHGGWGQLMIPEPPATPRRENIPFEHRHVATTHDWANTAASTFESMRISAHDVSNWITNIEWRVGENQE